MAKRRNWRPRPIPPHKLPTIKDIIIGPDGVQHEINTKVGWVSEVRRLYPGKYNHGDYVVWYAVKEGGARVRTDALIYDVETESWELEPHGHERGPLPNCQLSRNIQAILDKRTCPQRYHTGKLNSLPNGVLEEKLSRIPTQDWRGFCSECGNDYW